MGKRVELSFLSGDFTQGFPATLRIINDEDGQVIAVSEGTLPPNGQILADFETWRQEYLFQLDAMGNNHQIEKTRRKKQGKRQPPDDQNSDQLLAENLDNWLNSSRTWQAITQTLYRYLNPDEEIRVIIQTDNPKLRQIPWLIWFDKHFTRAEVAVSPLASRKIETEIVYQPRVRILAILGNNEDINLEFDRNVLESLRSKKAKIEVLEQPTRQELVDKLWDDQGWHIFFFAGHSGTDKEGNIAKFELSQEESISIDELKRSFREAIRKGLQFAIFNSCDGLGLGEQLADLQLPQSVVMREEIPDIVAQKFIENFLTAFSRGESFYGAVREARGKLDGWKHLYSGIEWLPIICQNSAVIPLTWEQLRKGKRSHSTKNLPQLPPKEREGKQYLYGKIQENIEEQLRLTLGELWTNQELIILSKELQENQVERSWDRHIIFHHESQSAIDSYENICKVFEHPEVKRKLLILGAPGCGKTTTLLQLAEYLLDSADPEDNFNEPLPVMFHLVDWQPINKGNLWNKKLEDPTIYEWLILQLNKDYPRSQKYHEKWVKEGKLILLFDGLDELPFKRQEKCVIAINDFLNSEFEPPAVVICSRKKEYESYNSKLKLNNCIVLQSLTEQQIEQHCKNLGKQNLWKLLKQDFELLELAKTPFFLMIINSLYIEETPQKSILNYYKSSSQDLQSFLISLYCLPIFTHLDLLTKIAQKDPNKLKNFLNNYGHEVVKIFNYYLEKDYKKSLLMQAYIEKILIEEPTRRTSKKRVKTYKITHYLKYFRWLNYLSYQEVAINSFMTPGLPRWYFKDKKKGLTYMLLFFLVYLVILNYLVIGYLAFSLSNSLPFVYCVLMINQILRVIYTQDNLMSKNIITGKIKFSFLNFFKSFKTGFSIGGLAGVLLGTIITPDLRFQIYMGTIIGLITEYSLQSKVKNQKNFQFYPLYRYMILNLLASLIAFYIKHRDLSDIFKYIFFELIILIGCCLTIGGLLGLFYGLIHGLVETKNTNQSTITWSFSLNSIILSLILSIGFGVISQQVFASPLGVFIGIFVWLIFGGYKFLMCISDRFILALMGYLPWNLARFLDYCTERRILQRVGGRYRFIHRLLQEHFANMDINQLKTQLEKPL